MQIDLFSYIDQTQQKQTIHDGKVCTEDSLCRAWLWSASKLDDNASTKNKNNKNKYVI